MIAVATYIEIGNTDIELIDGDRGKNYPHQNELRQEGDCVFLSANNVTTDGFKFDNVVYITAEKDRALRNGKIQRGDIVITTRGTVGNVAYYNQQIPYDNIRINSGMLIVRCHEQIKSEFLYYVLRGVEFQRQIKQIQTGTAQPQLPKSHFIKMKIIVPTIDVQEKIAKILRTIDEKIESNKCINENLEQQAQAYFNDLFVVNADPNWPECTLSDIGSVVAGGTPSKSKPEYYADQGIAWITPKDLSVDKSKFISHGENDISELGFSKSSTKKMPAGTVLFSSRAPIGYIAIAQNELTTNQGFKSVIPNKNIGTSYVYFLLKNLLPAIEGMASGSTFKEISGAGMKSVPTVMPDVDTIQLFNNFCEPIFKEQEVLEAENRRLSALRDLLLPKLMSGEIDIPSLDI